MTIQRVALVLALAAVATALDFGRVYSGDGTYYGATEGGNCAMRQPRPSFYQRMVPVAINDAQYEGSLTCGTCLQVTGSGQGSGGNPIKGTFKAYIMDRCPECAPGDIDLGMSGDGRWKVSWKPIPCPASSNDLAFQFEGSHEFYWKLQPRGMKSPAKSVTVDGIPAARSQDNHFVAQNDGGFKMPVTVVVTTMTGETFSSQVSQSSGVVRGRGTSRGGGKRRSGGRKRRPRRRRSRGRKRRSRSGRSRRRKRPSFRRRGKCAGKWRRCGPRRGRRGRRSYRGPRRCCNPRYVCRNARGRGSRRFSGKRCEPRR